MKKIFVIFTLIFGFVFCFCACSAEEETIKIITITDTHFTGGEYFSYEGSFLSANDTNGTGKQVRYIEDILDAFIFEMLEEKPDYILITGDLSFDGARVSHLALAEKLRQLKDAGITVLVLPGNHDIKSYALIFPNGEPEMSDPITAEEFADIYSDFGYTGAVSYDPKSLSYVYDTGKGARIFMLDTNLTYGATIGKIEPSTISWIEEQLAACKEAGDSPIVAGHHSLLSHNPRFDLSYKLMNGDEIASLITEYGANLYLCGHLHTQHYVQTETLTDIVGGGFIIYPHRYGVIEYGKDGWNYKSETTDVAAYAESIGSTDENLLNYTEYGYNFFYNNAYAQSKGTLSEVIEDEELLEKYAVFSAKLNVAYFGGTYSDVDLSIAEDFIAAAEGTGWASYMKTVLLDTKDSISCSWPVETEE
ncbi:MAG: metallophosphoesterase [Oscillospiraceae bacterium]|nr:metallophosphoesterase [Oscillospiraceae bacterium]